MSANGYLTGAELSPIDNGQRLAHSAAPWYMAMREEAARDGVNIVCVEGYRDFATQQYLYALYLAGKGNPASSPGSSPHGWGLAVDLNTSSFGGAVFNWLTNNAARFGFNNRVGRSIGEHWHWVFEPTAVAGLTPPTAIVTNKGEEKVSYGIRNAVRVGALPGLPVGAVLIGSGTDPLVWVSNAGVEQANGVVIADWSDKQIAERIAQVGIRGSGRDLDKVFASLADAMAKPSRPLYALGK